MRPAPCQISFLRIALRFGHELSSKEKKRVLVEECDQWSLGGDEPSYPKDQLLHLRATGQLAGQNHIERHRPIQAHLARALG